MIPIVMSEIMNQMKTNSHSKIQRLDDYDKTLPVVEVYPCVQSEGSRQVMKNRTLNKKSNK